VLRGPDHRISIRRADDVGTAATADTDVLAAAGDRR
jgi:hypothetical protein